MRLIRCLVLWKVCLWPLAALGSAQPPGRALVCFGLTGCGLWHHAPRPGCSRLCPAAWPGSGPAVPHWHLPTSKGARNLVVEVRRIALDDGFGVPVATFR